MEKKKNPRSGKIKKGCTIASLQGDIVNQLDVHLPVAVLSSGVVVVSGATGFDSENADDIDVDFD